MTNTSKMKVLILVNKLNFCNIWINQMNIWKLQAPLWVNKLNIFNKIEIYPIFQKWGFCYGWTNWTFVTYELIRRNIWKLQASMCVNKLYFCNRWTNYINISQHNFWYGWTYWTFVTNDLIRWISENCKLHCGWTDWTCLTK